MILDKPSASDERKRRAAEAVLVEVETGMKLGLGSGSTAEHFVRFLGERVRAGLDVVGVPTSERTRKLAEAVGIKLTTLDADPALDLTIDGADEVDPALRLIKGGGGAFLREKIVAAASARMLVVCDESKLVPVLGAFPLPIEIVPFGLGATRRAIDRAVAELGLAATMTLRRSGSEPFLTDSGHYILDASFGRIPDPNAVASVLASIPGVVEHGLFIGLAVGAVVGRRDRVEWLAA